jgi:hypothetical protein
MGQLGDCRPRTEEQWDTYGGAPGGEDPRRMKAFIDSLVTPGHASTPGFNDVAHYVSGRLRQLTHWGAQPGSRSPFPNHLGIVRTIGFPPLELQ